jgi:hypothetical protein
MEGDVRLDAARNEMVVLEAVRARQGVGLPSALTAFDRSVTSPAVGPPKRRFWHRGRNDSSALGQPVATLHGDHLGRDTASARLGWRVKSKRDTELVQTGPPGSR